MPAHGEHFIFPCHRWLAKTEDDGKIERDLLPGISCLIYYNMILSYRSEFRFFEKGLASQGRFLRRWTVPIKVYKKRFFKEFLKFCCS